MAVTMTPNFFTKELNRIIHIDSEKYGYGADYIIHLRYRYRNERKWQESNELLLFRSFDYDEDEQYEWNNDWWEGQQELELLGIIRIENVTVPDLF